MKRQLGIFLIGSIALAVLGLVYAPQSITDLSLFHPTFIDNSGTKIVLTPHNTSDSSQADPEHYRLVAQNTQQVVSKRLEQLQISGHHGVSLNNFQVEVVIPNVENTPYILSLITRVGNIEFIDGGTNPPIGEYVETGETSQANNDQYETIFSGREINTIIPPDSQSGEVFYQIELIPSAAERISRFVSTQTNAYLCLVIDKEVIDCSQMYHWSDNTLDILPKLSSRSDLGLSDLAVFLNSGPLPDSLDVALE